MHIRLATDLHRMHEYSSHIRLLHIFNKLVHEMPHYMSAWLLVAYIMLESCCFDHDLNIKDWNLFVLYFCIYQVTILRITSARECLRGGFVMAHIQETMSLQFETSVPIGNYKGMKLMQLCTTDHLAQYTYINLKP